MAKRYKRNKYKRRRSRMSSSNAGPILALLGTVLGILGLAALLVFVALPRLLPLIGVDFTPPWQPSPTPQPTARPTPTQHPILTANIQDMQTEVLLPTEYAEYRWYADPYAYGNRLLFVAGRLTSEGEIPMDALFSLDMNTGSVERLNAHKEYRDYVYPVCNDTWLVYLDSEARGGGAIRALNWETNEVKMVKRIYTGQPRLHLDGDHLAWMDQTGSLMDKLFVSDLRTLESAAVETFSNTPYGQSDVSIRNGEIIYAYEDRDAGGATGGGLGSSGIYSVALSSGAINTYYPGTYVHDPMTNGKYWVWRDGLHGEGNSLYFTSGSASPRKLAEDIVDYGLSDTFVAYSRTNEPIRVYFFELDTTIAITPEVDRERTQFMGVSNGVVIWMDVTSRERDIMKYARVEQ